MDEDIMDVLETQIKLLFSKSKDILFTIKNEDEEYQINLSLLLKYLLTETRLVTVSGGEASTKRARVE